MTALMSADLAAPIDLGTVLWQRQQEILEAADRLMDLRRLVDWGGDLTPGQWFQLYALTLEFKPDLIVELGRGYGNSTCVFTEAANRLGSTSVVSVGYDAEAGWRTRTAPRVMGLVGPSWFEPLEIQEKDIRSVDFAELFERRERVLLFWDAHGMDLAWYLLANAIPALRDIEHLVVVHDLTDSRYDFTPPDYIRPDGEVTHWNAYLVSPFPEVVPLMDFLSRNKIPFWTPQDTIHSWFESEPTLSGQLREVFARSAFVDDALNAGGWIGFSAQASALVYPDYPEVSKGFLAEDEMTFESPQVSYGQPSTKVRRMLGRVLRWTR